MPQRHELHHPSSWTRHGLLARSAPNAADRATTPPNDVPVPLANEDADDFIGHGGQVEGEGRRVATPASLF